MNSKGRAYTQRVEPRLSLVEVELPKDAFLEGWEPNKTSYLGKLYVIMFKLCLDILVFRAIIYLFFYGRFLVFIDYYPRGYFVSAVN